MIMYKLEDINNTISEMNNNVTGILDRGEEHLSSDIQKYRNDNQLINNDINYTELGKKEKSKELSEKYYEEIQKQGENFIQEIEREYDSAIEKVSTLMQYDSERKIVQADKVDKVKENSDLIYATQVLNSIDDETEAGMLKELLNQYQANEKIINLVKLKANKLNKNDVNSSDLNEVIKEIKLLDTDYVEQLKGEKLKKANFFREKKYPCKSFSHDLEELYGINKSKIEDFFR